jgi:hypothetical protein
MSPSYWLAWRKSICKVCGMFDNGRNAWIVRLHLAAGIGENVEMRYGA